MTANQTVDAMESLDSFCATVSRAIASDGFDVRIQPGDHLVDDAGADSLTVLMYFSHLQKMGIPIALNEFDSHLLNINSAYQSWLKAFALRETSRTAK